MRAYFANLFSSSSRRTSIIALAGLVLCLYVIKISHHSSRLPSPNNKPHLSLTLDQTFKIVQVADLHLGEEEATEWGPEQDFKTWKALDAVLTAEAPFDLIVLSGDQLTANNCDKNATAYYKLLGDFLTKFNTPWALIFGNHDDAPLEIVDPVTGNRTYVPAKTSRLQLARVDQSYPLSLTQVGPSDLFGTSNYVLDIFASHTQDLLSAQIYLFDSGGGSLAQTLQANQVDWFHQQRVPNIPAVAFQHIPTQHHTFLLENCVGFNGDGGIGAVDSDAGMVDAFLQDDNVLFVSVGHNHGNDYCCSLSGKTLHLCFGRHSGYGGYGTWDRGVRVYQLDFSSFPSVQWKSWVRMESGAIQDEYDPSIKSAVE